MKGNGPLKHSRQLGKIGLSNVPVAACDLRTINGSLGSHLVPCST